MPPIRSGARGTTVPHNLTTHISSTCIRGAAAIVCNTFVVCLGKLQYNLLYAHLPIFCTMYNKSWVLMMREKKEKKSWRRLVVFSSDYLTNCAALSASYQ